MHSHKSTITKFGNKNFNDFKIAANFCFQILIAVLYHCMFKYVLFFSPDETLEQGRNAS